MLIGFHQTIVPAHEKIPLSNWKRESQRTPHKNTPLECPNIKRLAQQRLVKNKATTFVYTAYVKWYQLWKIWQSTQEGSCLHKSETVGSN